MDLLQIVNATMCGGIGLVLVAAVLSPRVRDGVVIKTGLITMAAGFLSLAWVVAGVGGAQCEAPLLLRLLALVHTGVLVVVVGYVLRARKAHPMRRATDWAELDDGDGRTEVHAR